MSIPPEILNSIEQIDQEISQIVQDLEESFRLVRPLLNRFPNNSILLQIFAALNNFELFANNYRRRLQNIEASISSDISDEAIQEAGEELGEILGQTIDARITVINLRDRIANL